MPAHLASWGGSLRCWRAQRRSSGQVDGPGQGGQGVVGRPSWTGGMFCSDSPGLRWTPWGMCPPAAPPQKARLPEATEPPRREAALLHNVNNQISQDGEPRTDSWYVISSTRVAQGGSQDRSGAQQAQGLCRGHSKSHLLSASLIPEPREGRDQQTGGVTEQKVTCRE